MRVPVVNELGVACSGLPGGQAVYKATLNLIQPTGGDHGGLHLEVSSRRDPRADRHYYFSQEDRIRIGLFLLAGVPLRNLELKFKYPKELGGVTKPPR